MFYVSLFLSYGIHNEKQSRRDNTVLNRRHVRIFLLRWKSVTKDVLGFVQKSKRFRCSTNQKQVVDKLSLIRCNILLSYLCQR